MTAEKAGTICLNPSTSGYGHGGTGLPGVCLARRGLASRSDWNGMRWVARGLAVSRGHPGRATLTTVPKRIEFRECRGSLTSEGKGKKRGKATPLISFGAHQIIIDTGTASPTARDSAGRIANELVKLDLAEKGGSHHRPVLRQSAILRNLVR